LEADDYTPASRPVPPQQQTEATLLDIGGSSGGGLNVAGTDFVLLKYSVCVCVYEQQCHSEDREALKELLFTFST